jgi:hypothetical protein
MGYGYGGSYGDYGMSCACPVCVKEVCKPSDSWAGWGASIGLLALCLGVILGVLMAGPTRVEYVHSPVLAGRPVSRFAPERLPG